MKIYKKNEYSQSKNNNSKTNINAFIQDIKDKDITQIFKKLNSSEKGLSEIDAKERINKYGPNEIIEKKPSIILKFFKKFIGPIPFMLELAIIVSYILSKYPDMYIIFALLIFNSIVSFIEEYKADNSLQMLKKRITVNARVLRDSNWITKPARELTIGDIVRVRIGDIIPADMKIISAQDLSVDQSILTGETHSKFKDKNDILYSGSIVKNGEAVSIVTGIGYNTYFGYTTKLVETARPQLHLEKEILRIMKYIIVVDVLLVIFLFIYASVVLKFSIASMLPFGIILLMASVPVALPAAITVSTAIGTEKLAKKSVLITKLDAIEEASNVNVICFDKTGTITQNLLQVKDVFALSNYSRSDVILNAALASKSEDNDSIDMAIINEAITSKYNISGFNQIKFTPFTPATKSARAVIKPKSKNQTFEVVKGAVEILIQMCKLNEKQKQIIIKKSNEFSKNEFRTIAVIKRQHGSNFEFLGIIALYDKPRKDAKQLIKELKNLGLNIKMLTGDDIAIATQIAKEVGIGTKIISSSQLKNKTQDEIADLIEESSGFAEIYPEDKFLIVKALQRKGYRVAMTGDGINDAPALKQADVGICVKSGTDIAKSVSDIVLLKDGIEVVVDAIKESRKIFERIRTYTMFKLIRVFQLLFFIFFIFIFLKIIPMTAFMLILLIFTIDIANISLSTDKAVYSKFPDTWDVKNLVNYSAVLSMVSLSFLLFLTSLSKYFVATTSQFQTYVFLMFEINAALMLYTIRSRLNLFGLKPGKYVVLTSLFGILFSIFISYYGIFVAKINIYAIILILILTIVYTLFFDFIKLALYKYFKV